MAAKRKYPWEEWFSQPSTLLVYGEHYHCAQSIMWQMIRSNAYQRRVRVRVTDLRTEILIEVIGDRDEVLHTDEVAVTS